MSQAFSPTRVSARAVGVEIPKRSAAQVSGDVAPSSRYAWRRSTSPSNTTIFPSAAAFCRKARSSSSVISSFDRAAGAEFMPVGWVGGMPGVG